MSTANTRFDSPTPIQFVQRLQGNAVYMKRDDLLPFSFGGNKARKNHLFFQEIDAQGCDCVVTYGSSDSNHCRIVANMCTERGLSCLIISPEEGKHDSYNKTLNQLLGAQYVYCRVTEVAETIGRVVEELRRAGRKPYFIPGGGHGLPGTQAYVDCYREICAQERAMGLHFDYIFHASGTGATQAGLVCGQALQKDERRIVGVSIARKAPRGRQVVVDSVHEYLAHVGVADPESADSLVVFEDAYTGDGYGRPDADVDAQIRLMFVRHGIPLDAVYTGKAYTGMVKWLEAQGVEGKNVLFIHTGGTPLFFDAVNRVCQIEDGE